LELAKTGQARVLKVTESQRLLNPIELLQLKNVDFVFSTTINKNIETTPHRAYVEFSVWKHQISKPLSVIKNFIE
jgi:hypothetical protein